MMDLRLGKSSACPSCGKTLNSAGASDGSDDRPSPGDITICLYCHHLMAFADDLSFRELTSDEMVEAAGDPDLLRAMKMLEAYKREKQR